MTPDSLHSNNCSIINKKWYNTFYSNGIILKIQHNLNPVSIHNLNKRAISHQVTPIPYAIYYTLYSSSHLCSYWYLFQECLMDCYLSLLWDCVLVSVRIKREHGVRMRLWDLRLIGHHKWLLKFVNFYRDVNAVV